MRTMIRLFSHRTELIQVINVQSFQGTHIPFGLHSTEFPSYVKMYFEEALALENTRQCSWWESTISAPDPTGGKYLVSNDTNSFNKLDRGVQIKEQPWLHARGGKLSVLRTSGNQSRHIPLHRALYQTILPIAEHHKIFVVLY